MAFSFSILGGFGLAGGLVSCGGKIFMGPGDYLF